MLELALLVVAGALRWCSASGSLVASTASMTEFVCLENDRHLDVKAHYRTVHSVSVRVANSSFGGQCIVNVAFTTSSERRQRELSPLLLVKVERLQLFLPGDFFYLSNSNASKRTDNYCKAEPCDPTYLFASQSVQLYLYVTSSLRVLASYVAAFVVTEATNVCGLAGRSGELLVQSSGSIEYAFAPHSRHKQLPPNNTTCARDFNYSLTIRTSSPSGSVNVNVLACPSDKRCETLLLNGRSCSDGATVASAPPGSPVTLIYVLRRCDGDRGFTGFVVSAEVFPPAELPSTAATATTASSLLTRTSTANNRATREPTAQAARSTPTSLSVRVSSSATGSSSDAFGATRARAASTTRSLRPLFTIAYSITNAELTSSAADASADRRLVESHAGKELGVTIVATSVAASAATALAIGVAAAILCRRRRLRSAGQKAPVRDVLRAHSTALASGEEIAMLDNDLYGETLASTTAAHQ